MTCSSCCSARAESEQADCERERTMVEQLTHSSSRAYTPHLRELGLSSGETRELHDSEASAPSGQRSGGSNWNSPSVSTNPDQLLLFLRAHRSHSYLVFFCPSLSNDPRRSRSWRCWLLHTTLVASHSRIALSSCCGLPSVVAAVAAMPSANKKKKKSNKQPKPNNPPHSQPTDDIADQLSDDETEHPAPHSSNPTTATQPSSPLSFHHSHSAYERMTVQPISATLPSHLVPPTDPLSHKINALPPTASPFSIYTSTIDTAGRRAIARRTLHPGQLLICETALPAVLHSDWKGRVCAKCFVTVGEGSGGGAMRVCRACESVVYCSTACLMADVDVHRLECKVMKELGRISDESMVNIDLVRAALAYIVGRHPQRADDEDDDHDDSAASTASPSKPAGKPSALRTDRFTPEWEDVEGMVDNLSAVTPVDMQHMTAAAALLLSLLPPTTSLACLVHRLVHVASQQ